MPRQNNNPAPTATTRGAATAPTAALTPTAPKASKAKAKKLPTPEPIAEETRRRPLPLPGDAQVTSGTPYTDGSVAEGRRRLPVAGRQNPLSRVATLSGAEIIDKTEQHATRVMTEVTGLVAGTTRVATGGALGVVKGLKGVAAGMTPLGAVLVRAEGKMIPLGAYDFEGGRIYVEHPMIDAAGVALDERAQRRDVRILSRIETSAVVIPLYRGQSIAAALVLDEATGEAFLAKG